MLAHVRSVSWLGFFAALAVAASAGAQPLPDGQPPPGQPPPLQPQPMQPMGPPPAMFAPPPPVPETRPPERSDHENVVRHLGLGFLGIGDLPLPIAEPRGTKENPGLATGNPLLIRSVSTPTIGARIWLRRRIGVDTGLGFSYAGGSTSADLGKSSRSVPKQSVLGLMLHGGLPLVAADTEHMALLVIPEASFGMARSNVEPVADGPPSAALRGYRLDVGVRAGAEIHFGFMDLPRLSLEAGIGLAFTTQWVSASVGNQSISDTSTRLTTTSFANPWDIFRLGNVAARYYF